MSKIIANILLPLLLAVCVLSWIAVLQPSERQKINPAYQFSFPGELEDQQSDSDPTKDNETNQNSDVIMENYALLPWPLRLRQNESRQEELFSEHDRDVGTPPPKQ
jgi:hypothetical protein